MIIAIDGPSGAGKGTIAQFIKEAFEFYHMDTGLLYRALAYEVINAPQNMSEEEIIKLSSNLDLSLLQTPHLLRGETIALKASTLAAIPQIRSALLGLQRDFAYNARQAGQGVVLDGRDIGTVVLPDADLKFFVTAELEIRAQRRFKELSEKDPNLTFDEIFLKLYERDKQDKERSTAPLTQPQDAIIIDTSHLTIDQGCEKAYEIIRKILDGQQSSQKKACGC